MPQTKPPASTAPRHLLVVFMVLHLMAWTLVPWLTNTSLPLDVTREGLSWGHEFAWGYYKHPPLPSWLVEISFRALGTLGPYLLSQLFIAATLTGVYLLGRRLLSETQATAGTLALAFIPFFTWPTPEFNHNLAQMPLWPLALLLLHRLMAQPTTRDWLLLAGLSAIGLYSKYVFGLLMLLMLLYLLASKQRTLLAQPSAWLAAAVFAALMLPHTAWLVNHDFQTLHYLAERSESASGNWQWLLNALDFLAVQLLNMLLGMLVFWWLCRPLHARTVVERLLAPDMRFLLWFAVAPILSVALLVMLTGSQARDMWAVPMLSLSGLLIVHAMGGELRPRQLRLVFILACVLTVLLAGLYGLKAVHGESRSGKPMRTGWPAEELAGELTRFWSSKTACPLRVINGENWLAGLAAYPMKDRPQVLINNDYLLSPWLDPQQVKRTGQIIIRDISKDAASMRAESLANRLTTQLSLNWPRAPELPALRIEATIVLPAVPCLPVNANRSDHS